jgi:hypothetical protein
MLHHSHSFCERCRQVPVPEGLDLDKWINEPPKEEELPKAKDLFSWDDLAVEHVKSPLEDEPDSEAMLAKRAQRKLAQQANPFFLGSLFVVVCVHSCVLLLVLFWWFFGEFPSCLCLGNSLTCSRTVNAVVGA